MKKLVIFLIGLNMCCFILAFTVNFSFPFDEWRKGPPVHYFSAYSSQNASKTFWVATACLLDLYLVLIFLFSHMVKKKREFASKTACLVIAVTIFAGSFLVVEYATRAYIRNSPGYSRFRPHPLLFWYNRPDFSALNLSINSSGFRYGENIPVRKPSGEYRIFVFGDSSAFGDSVGDKETFSYQLEKKLNEEYGGRKFRVINAACPGHTTYQGLILLKQEILKFSPDMLVIAYNNDSGLEYVEEKARSFQSSFIKKLNAVFYRSDYYLLFQRVATNFRLFLSAKINKINAPPLVHRVSIEDYKANIGEFMRISKERGIRDVFVKMPVNLEAFKVFPFLEELFYDESYRNALTEICKRPGYTLVDVDANWPVKSGQGLFEIVEHNGKMGEAHFHPSSKGHQKIAEQLYDTITQNRLIH